MLIFALQSGSAAFTPTFHATIPDVLPDEAEYTRALSLSHLAYDLEAFASPAIAAGLLAGAALLSVGLLLGPLVAGWSALLTLWAALGFGNGLVLTPAGRLLRRSAEAPDRPALFAAQFALSHACWLLTYPFAGRLGAGFGIAPTFLLLALVAAAGLLAAWRLWPAGEPGAIAHMHKGLPADHPHLMNAVVEQGGYRHAHPPLADGLHAMRP